MATVVASPFSGKPVAQILAMPSQQQIQQELADSNELSLRVVPFEIANTPSCSEPCGGSMYVLNKSSFGWRELEVFPELTDMLRDRVRQRHHTVSHKRFPFRPVLLPVVPGEIAKRIAAHRSASPPIVEGAERRSGVSSLDSRAVRDDASTVSGTSRPTSYYGSPPRGGLNDAQGHGVASAFARSPNSMKSSSTASVRTSSTRRTNGGVKKEKNAVMAICLPCYDEEWSEMSGTLRSCKTFYF